MKSLKLMLVFISIFTFAACGKEKEQPKKKPAAPRVCAAKCPEGQPQKEYPDCACIVETFTPDLALQAELLNAVAKDDKNFITAQLNKGADVNARLGFAGMDNFLAFRETLQKSGFIYNIVKKDADDLTMLFFAVALKKNGVVDILLSRRADINIPSFGKTPLMAALLNKDAALARKLLERGARPDVAPGPDNDLLAALNNKDYQTAAAIVRYAKANNIDIKPVLPDFTAAVAANDIPLVTFLLDNAGISPDTLDGSGRPLLISAAMSDNAGSVKLLLAAGFAVDKQDNDGFTALMRLAPKAANAKDLQLIQFLLDNGASVSIEDNAGYQPLHHAMRGDNTGVVELLLAAGADVNAVSPDSGRTPIFTAAMRGSYQLVKLLLDNGAKAKIKDNSGKTPAQYAVERGHMAVYDLLEKQRQ